MGTLKKMMSGASLAKAYILKTGVDAAHGQSQILWRVFRAGDKESLLNLIDDGESLQNSEQESEIHLVSDE